MRSHNHGTLRYYTFETFPSSNLTHAVFGRQGGISPSPYDTLNMSISMGDSLSNVRQNRCRAFDVLNLSLDSVSTLWQVHGSKTIVVGNELCDPYTRGDALVTNRVGVSLFLRFADCVPIFLVDPVRKAIGIAHAGWRGVVSGVIQAAVKTMVSHFRCQPYNILAGIGPSVGPDQYRIGPQVSEAIEQAFPRTDLLLLNRNGRVHLDLWAASEQALRNCGVLAIETARLCTATHSEQFFSHRGEQGRAGRFGAVIALHA